MAKIGVIKNNLLNKTIADKCPKCGRMSELQLKFTQNVFIIGFPLFPMDKKAEIVCTTCKNEIALHRAPKYVAQIYDEVLPTIKTPKWTYSGSILIAGVFLFMLIYIPIENNKKKNYINNVKIGDIYKIRYKDNNAIFDKDLYSLLRVVDVKDDAIFVTPSIYEKHKPDLSSIDKSDKNSWSDDTLLYSKKELQNMVESLSTDNKVFEIIDVDKIE